jgi:hypothetical protein
LGLDDGVVEIVGGEFFPVRREFGRRLCVCAWRDDGCERGK